MKKAIDLCAAGFDKKGFHYEISKDGEALMITFDCPNYKNARYFFRFSEKNDDGSTYVKVATYPTSFAQGDFAKGLIACNEMNKHFRWIRFYIDKDKDICADIDGVLYDDTCADECFKLLAVLAGTCNDAYPSFMKALWA